MPANDPTNEPAINKAKQIVIFSDEPGWHGKQLRNAFENRGYQVEIVSLSACNLNLTADSSDNSGAVGVQSELLSIPGVELKQLCGAFVRGIPGGSLESVVSRLNVLHALDALRIPVFNTGRAIERTVDKSMTSFLLHRSNVPSVDTWVTESKSRARDVAADCIERHGAVVTKPLFGSQGKGVERITTLKAFDAFIPISGVYYLQSYVKPVDDSYRDWRVFVINNRAIAAMQRVSQCWVTNRAQGAACKFVSSNPELFGLAEKAAAALDVDYAGVDLMRGPDEKWVVTEVNGIPAWQGLQRVAQLNIAELLVDAHLNKIERHARRLTLLTA